MKAVDVATVRDLRSYNALFKTDRASDRLSTAVEHLLYVHPVTLLTYPKQMVFGFGWQVAYIDYHSQPRQKMIFGRFHCIFFPDYPDRYLLRMGRLIFLGSMISE